MSNSLDPDEARQIVWPHLGPNCLQGFSADDTRANLRNAEYIEDLECSCFILFIKQVEEEIKCEAC